MKLLSILMIIFNILTFTNTSNGITFNDNINKCYNEYIICVDENTSFGDVALVYGTYKDNYYLSCYLYGENNSTSIYLRIKLDNKITTYVMDSNVIEGYGLKVKSVDVVGFYFYSNDIEILIKEFTVEELNQLLLNNPLIGQNQGHFPRNKKEVSIETKLMIFIACFVILASAFVVLLVFLYIKRVGKFKKEESDVINTTDYTYINNNDYYNSQDYESNNDSKNIEVDTRNKEEIMDDLFKQFRSGDITEEELNERLKNLWWKDHD